MQNPAVEDRDRPEPGGSYAAGQNGFGTVQHLAAWAGICPANHESAGKQKRRGTRKGNPYLKATLVTAAVCGARKAAAICATSFTGSGHVWERRRRPWPSATRSWSPSSTC